MSETKTECRTYKVTYSCDVCAKGTMEASGSVIDTNPPQYQHVCNDCGDIAYYYTRYPEIRWEPTEALKIDRDAFEQRVKEQAKMQFYSDIHFGEEEK